METKLTVIVDNVASKELSGEWGLCILAEYEDKKILIDTGASQLFAHNLKGLGFDIKDIDFGTLSHAHYDHAGGMERFFKDNEKAPFYLRESSDENCYFKKFIFHKYIGIPKNLMSEYSDRIKLVSGDCKICEGVYLIPHKTEGLEEIGKREMMYQKIKAGTSVNGKVYARTVWKADNYSHEQSLVLDTDKGLVIINCCSHGGAVNIINEVKSTFPDKQIYGLIGGFHLFNKSEEEIRKVSRAIKETGIKYVCTGHCTKDRACKIMQEELGDIFEQLHVGLIMKF